MVCRKIRGHAGQFLIEYRQLPVGLVDDLVDLNVEIPVFVCQSLREVFLVDAVRCEP